MKPYFSEDGMMIFNCDCREWFAYAPPCLQVNLLLTDPPYGVGFDYGTEYEDKHSAYGDMLCSWLPLAESMSESCAVFQSARNVTWWHPWFSPREYRLIAIPKSFVQWTGAQIQWSTDYVLVWKVGRESTGVQKAEPKRMHTDNTPRDWFVSSDSCIVGTRPDHPCPRPMDMMVFLVDLLSQPGYLILDPFMGSGTTLRAAKDLGRRAIGIEIEEKYCEIAAKRLSQKVFDFEGQ